MYARFGDGRSDLEGETVAVRSGSREDRDRVYTGPVKERKGKELKTSN